MSKMKEQRDIFPFLKILEENYRAIREEVITILYNETVNDIAYFTPAASKGSYKGEWDVFRLFIAGVKWQPNCDKCPKTTKFLEQVPDLSSAYFSSMAVGTHIQAHSSANTENYRGHLGLIVPKKGAKADTRFPGGLRHCGMRIEDEFYTLEEGDSFVFDERKEHELWNYGDRTRIVLSFSFKRPSPGRPLEKVGTFYSDK